MITKATHSNRRINLIYVLFLCLCPLPDLPGQDKSFVRSAEPPAITTDLASIDFGEILAGEVVTKKLKISNIGKGDLDLLKLDFTCGCTIPQVLMPSGDIVVPDRKGEKMIGTLKTDESAVIDLEYSALGQRGKMKKSLTIYSNDPREREKMLVIEAMIKSPFEIQPRRLYFGDVDRGNRVEKCITLRSIRAGDFTIPKIHGNPPYLEYRAVKKENTETPTVDILFVITEDAPIGFQNLKLRAEVDSERVRETNIHVTFNVLPPVSFMVDGKTAKDAIFDFGVLKAGQGAMKELEIINQNPEIPYDITEMSLNSRHEEFIESDLVTLEEGIRYKLTVRIKPEIDARFFRGVIKLISEHPDLKKKEIPLKGWISED